MFNHVITYETVLCPPSINIPFLISSFNIKKILLGYHWISRIFYACKYVWKYLYMLCVFNTLTWVSLLGLLALTLGKYKINKLLSDFPWSTPAWVSACKFTYMWLCSAFACRSHAYKDGTETNKWMRGSLNISWCKQPHCSCCWSCV